MRKILTRAAAVFSAAVMAACCTAGNLGALAADEKPEGVKVIFNIGGKRGLEGYEPELKTNLDDFKDMYVTGRAFPIPDGSFTLDGYTFSGWSYDGIYGYEGGDKFYLPEGVDEVVINGMWTVDDEELMKITYDLVYKGEQLEKPFAFKDKYGREDKIYTPYDAKIELDHAFSKGFYCSDLVEGKTFTFLPDEKLVMPDHPITLVPRFLEIVSFTYTTGDVDRVNGNPSYTFPRNEGSSTELAEADRLSRSGFALTGWHSSFDDKVYAPGETITVPGEDVVWTAVWTPKTYNIVFITGNGGSNIKVPGMTDTSIICPEPDISIEGKKFRGWQASDKKIYPVGSEYFVYGAMPGLGISLKGVWVDDDQTPVEGPTLPGDANCDGEVTIADAAAVMQALGNKDKYGLSSQGKANADVYNTGDGVTTKDAFAIQILVASMAAEKPVVTE